MKAAFDSSTDPIKLLLEIARTDPVAAAPGIVLVAEFDAERTAELVADVVQVNHDNVVPLLSDLVAQKPDLAARIVHFLFSIKVVHPTALAPIVLQLNTARRRYPDLVTRVLAASIALRDTDRLARAVIDLLHSDDRHFESITITFRQIFARPDTRPAAAGLLSWVSRTELPVGVEIFLDIITTEPAGEHPTAAWGAPARDNPLEIIDKYYPRGCPVLMIACIYGNTHTGRQPDMLELGSVLAEFARVNPARCAALIETMSVRNRRNPQVIMPIIAGMSDPATTATILLSIGETNIDVAATLLGLWGLSRYPEVPKPSGFVVARMVGQDVGQAARILARVAEIRPSIRPAGVLLLGLERSEQRSVIRQLRDCVTTSTWQKIKPLVVGSDSGPAWW
jgi:hypothetical protein